MKNSYETEVISTVERMERADWNRGIILERVEELFDRDAVKIAKDFLIEQEMEISVRRFVDALYRNDVDADEVLKLVRDIYKDDWVIIAKKQIALINEEVPRLPGGIKRNVPSAEWIDNDKQIQVAVTMEYYKVPYHHILVSFYNLQGPAGVRGVAAHLDNKFGDWDDIL